MIGIKQLRFTPAHSRVAQPERLRSQLKVALRLAAILSCVNLCGCRSAAFDITPVCSKPAPLIGHYDHRALGYAIGLEHTENFWPTLSRWEGVYHMDVSHPWREANLLLVTVSPEEVARLRCDPEVKWIEHNSVVLIGADTPQGRDH